MGKDVSANECQEYGIERKKKGCRSILTLWHRTDARYNST